MLNILSRARTATNSCRCSLCNPPRATVPRRTAAAARSRRHGVNDAVTIFYGTVMAAALWTDAAGKIGQRKRLDDALEKTKGENERLKRQNLAKLKALGITVGGSDGSDIVAPARKSTEEKRSMESKRKRREIRGGSEPWAQANGSTEGFRIRYGHDGQNRAEAQGSNTRTISKIPAASLRKARLESKQVRIRKHSVEASTWSLDTSEIRNLKDRLGQRNVPKRSLSADEEISLLIGEAYNEEELVIRMKDDREIQAAHLEQARQRLSHKLAAAKGRRERQDLRSNIKRYRSEIESLYDSPESQTTEQDTSANRQLLVERALELKFEELTRLQDQLVMLKDMLAGGLPDAQRSGCAADIDDTARQLAHKRLELQDTIDNFMEESRSDNQVQTVSTQSWLPSAEAWPIGRTPKELWSHPSVFESNQYWRRRKELVMSTAICRLIKFGLGHMPEFSVKLGLDENDPLHSANLSSEKLGYEIKHQIRTYLTIRSLIKLRHEEFVLSFDRPSFPQYMPLESASDLHSEAQRVCALNNRICDVFATAKGSWEKLALVCEVLAKSDTPPNIHTFNILLINFSRIGLQGAQDIVYDALRGCGTTANEVTAGAMLQTFSCAKQGRRFDRFVQKMDAVNGEGLMNLDQSTADLVHNDRSVLTEHHWVRGQGRDWRENGSEDAEALDTAREQLSSINSPRDLRKVLRTPLNQQLYEALIIGYNDTNQTLLASRMIARMVASGFKVNAKILNALLRRHLNRPNVKYIQRLQHQLLNGHIHGSGPELTETVFLLSHIWNTALRLTPRSRGLEQGGTKQDKANLQQLHRRLNVWAVDRKLIFKDIRPRRFQFLSARRQTLLQNQIDLIRRLEKPVLNFRFDVQGTRNLTVSPPSTIWSARAPETLERFVQERLALLHNHYTKQHGPYPTLPQADGRLLGFALGHAASERVEELRLRRGAKALRRDQALKTQLLQNSLRQRSRPFSRRMLRRRRASRLRVRERVTTTVEKPTIIPRNIPEPSAERCGTTPAIHAKTNNGFYKGQILAADMSLVGGRLTARATIEAR